MCLILYGGSSSSSSTCVTGRGKYALWHIKKKKETNMQSRNKIKNTNQTKMKDKKGLITLGTKQEMSNNRVSFFLQTRLAGLKFQRSLNVTK